MASNPVLYPNVSRIPTQNPAGTENRIKPDEANRLKNEFDQSLNQAMERSGLGESQASSPDLSRAGQGLKFSAHATQRLRERQIQFDPEMMMKLSDAINKADAKGVQDTLVLTDKAALIVSVPNRTVVTAMDKNNLNGNVFTNIDGAVII